MNLMYNLISRKTDNYQSDIKSGSKTGKYKKGSSSSRKTSYMAIRDHINILSPIDRSTVAQNIYYGSVRVNSLQSSQNLQQNIGNSNNVLNRTLQKSGKVIQTQQNVWDFDMTPQAHQNGKKIQRHKTESDTFKTFDDKNNRTQNSSIVQQLNFEEISQSINQPERIMTTLPNQTIDGDNQNITLHNAQISRGDEIYNDEDFSTAQNLELHKQGSRSTTNLNSSNSQNQFRITKTKNGLRTPKQIYQKQALQQQFMTEQKQILQSQLKSKTSQRQRPKKSQKLPTKSSPDTFEMLREAQNKLKILQQSRYNNYSDLKQYSSEIKGVYSNLQAPLSEISNVQDQCYNQQKQNPQMKTQYFIKQSTLNNIQLKNTFKTLPDKISSDQLKRGSCIAKINHQESNNFNLILQSQQSQNQNDKLLTLSIKNQEEQIQQHQSSIQNNEQIQEITPDQTIQQLNNLELNSKNFSSNKQNEDPKSQYNSVQTSFLQNKENSNNQSKQDLSIKYHSLQLIQTNSLNQENDKMSQVIDQSQLLSCPSKLYFKNELLIIFLKSHYKIGKQVTLSDDEKKMYGDRFIEGYQKINLLGKGGFALVWLAKSYKNDVRVAIKQICKVNGSDSHIREMRVNQYFFDTDGTVKEQFSKTPGMNNLLKCYEIKQTPKDIFIVYELGGGSLSSFLYEIKGEFYKNERVYKINFTDLHDKLFQTKKNNLLCSLMRGFFNALDLLQQQKIVHCDVKPENILVEMDSKEESFSKVSLIDFGSCFSLKDTGSVGMATPEYLSPEMLDIFQNKFNTTVQRSQIEQLAKITHPWSVDMWSMGAVILEILTGLPHWLSYKCRIVDKQGKSSLKYGLFSTKGQDYEKIIQKQSQFCENFNSILKEIIKQFDCSRTGKKFLDLLKKMMKYNPLERISPQQALQHPFLNQQNDQSQKIPQIQKHNIDYQQ